MAFVVIPSADVDQGSIVDESLMSAKIKNDLDDLNARTIALEALSGGGGSASVDAKDYFAKIISGGNDNAAKFWKRRFHVLESTNLDSLKGDGEDFEQIDKNTRFINDQNFTIVSSSVASAEAYLGIHYYVEQSEQVQFKIKKGENFFCIGVTNDTVCASVWRVYVDGVNVNTLGLKDERDSIVSSSFSSNTATTQVGKLWHFYGLDGEEHVVTIRNENASALEIQLNYVDVGYRSSDYAIDHKIKLNAGVADVGGITSDFNEGDFTFTEPSSGLANGYTGMLKINEAGIVTKIDGLSSARTEIRANQTILFSSPVTSLPVKNTFSFPTSGICLFQMPSGESFFFSYASKTGAIPQSHSLDSILWQRQPTNDFTFLPTKASASWAVNEFRGDGRIEYWANPPIKIDGTNNKIDFEITVNGVVTQHSATIASGFYSADLVPLSNAFKISMQAAKPINGEYFLEWSESSQLWSLGVNDPEVSRIDFEWSTGANSSTDFGSVLGFSSDSINAKSYISPLIKQHKAQRVFVADNTLRDTEHASFKWSFSQDTSLYFSAGDKILDQTEFENYRRFTPTNNSCDIYPDDDCCGVTLTFLKDASSAYVIARIDNGDELFLTQLDRPNDVSSPSIGQLVHCFLSFPKGTHKVQIKFGKDSIFEVEASTKYIVMFGYRQWFTKPPWEALTPQEKILKTFEIQPLRLFGTYYGHNSALYSPQPNNDNINSLTEVGTWSHITPANAFNNRYRSTVSNGDYIDIEFSLQGNGGGVGIKTVSASAASLDVLCFISNSAIVELTDLVDRMILSSSVSVFDVNQFEYLGLNAGTYFCRIKNNSTSQLVNSAIVIYDTVVPQDNARTHTDIANNGQSVSFPINARFRAASRYAAINVPSYYSEGEMRRGLVSNYDYINLSHIISNNDNTSLVSFETNKYFLHQAFTNIGDYSQYTTFCRSLSLYFNFFSPSSAIIQPSIDGRNTNTISCSSQVKGGFAPTARGSSTSNFFNDFQSLCTFNAGLVYSLIDTRGMRTGKAILVDNTGAKEEVYIASFVTDTSFTIANALSVLTPASVVKVLFWGVHNLKVTSGDATDWYLSAFMYEPLPIEPSNLIERIAGVKEYYKEVRELEVTQPNTTVLTLSTATVAFVYPNYHSDGVAPSHKNIYIHESQSVSSASTLIAQLFRSRTNPRLKTVSYINPSAGSAIYVGMVIYMKSVRNILKKTWRDVWG